MPNQRGSVFDTLVVMPGNGKILPGMACSLRSNALADVLDVFFLESLLLITILLITISTSIAVI